MKDKIIRWWRYTKVREWYYDFTEGIRNIIRWAPVIYRDRDWDQHFIYEILKTKLEFQAKYIGDRDFHTEAKRDAERMRLVAKLIKLEQEEFYRMEYMDYEENEYWFEPCENNSELYEWKHKNISERHAEYFAKYPRQYKRVLNGEGRFARGREEGYIVDPTDTHKLAMEIAHMNQDRCRKLLFKIMEENISSWWD